MMYRPNPHMLRPLFCLGIGLFLLAVGCSDKSNWFPSENRLGERCSTNDDCGEREICWPKGVKPPGGMHPVGEEPPCSQANLCEEGFVCHPHGCDVPCSTERPCQASMRCTAQGVCEPTPCDEGFACLAYQQCVPPERENLAPSEWEHGCHAIHCKEAVDCPNSTYCAGSTCYDEPGVCHPLTYIMLP